MYTCSCLNSFEIKSKVERIVQLLLPLSLPLSTYGVHHICTYPHYTHLARGLIGFMCDADYNDIRTHYFAICRALLYVRPAILCFSPLCHDAWEWRIRADFRFDNCGRYQRTFSDQEKVVMAGRHSMIDNVPREMRKFYYVALYLINSYFGLKTTTIICIAFSS